ncbi:hypothetical protein BGZ88_012440 [Linnemannia elongata]|nr:hypothetical protein BGZ88_012440 [Linnemannia elongata]
MSKVLMSPMGSEDEGLDDWAGGEEISDECEDEGKGLQEGGVEKSQPKLPSSVLMSDNPLTLFCLVDGEATSNAFPVSTSTTKTIGDLIDLIKVKFPDTFNGVDAKDLSLWRVTIPDSDDAIPTFVNGVPENEKKKLRATDKVSVFGAALTEDTIHIIVQRPPSGNATLFDST